MPGDTVLQYTGHSPTTSAGALGEYKKSLRQRVDDSVAATLSVESWKYKPGSLKVKADAFFTIAAGIRHLDADVLGAQLRLSYKLANAWTLKPSDRQRAVELDRMLAELSMGHLRDDAAMFYMAIGMLQPHRAGASGSAM